MTSFDVRFWKIETRKGRRTPYRVRWVVAGQQFSDSFLTMALAESYRAKLITAARNGEGFDTETGLPMAESCREGASLAVMAGAPSPELPGG